MPECKNNPYRSWRLVLGQFSLLLLLVYLTDWLHQCFLCWGFLLSGVILGVWAVFSIGLGNFNVVPDVKTDALLIQRPPYRWIRHPMYSSLLLIAIGLLLNPFTWLKLLLCLGLLMVLNFKAAYEETLLCQRFDDYIAYKKHTWRFIPFVF